MTATTLVNIVATEVETVLIAWLFPFPVPVEPVEAMRWAFE